MLYRDRGEILRLILEEARVPYEVEVVGFTNRREYVKALAPHGKLPVLRNFDGNGHDLGQAGAITRFLEEKCGLAPNLPSERAQVEALYCMWFAALRNNGVGHDGVH
jgi:glutathione S-transferase